MDAHRIALYPGSFDPVTNGHLDVIRRAYKLFDEVIVAVGSNYEKNNLFSVEERIEFLEKVCVEFPDITIKSYDGLLLNAVKKFNANVVVRGLRAVSDFEWEFQMALMNRKMSEDYETIFLMPSPEHSFVSSTMIREVARLGGDFTKFVPAEIVDDICKKIEKQA